MIKLLENKQKNAFMADITVIVLKIIFVDFQRIKKEFNWYIKAQKKTYFWYFGISSLKFNGLMYLDSLSKSDILNKQFQSVFTRLARSPLESWKWILFLILMVNWQDSRLRITPMLDFD